MSTFMMQYISRVTKVIGTNAVDLSLFPSSEVYLLFYTVLFAFPMVVLWQGEGTRSVNGLQISIYPQLGLLASFTVLRRCDFFREVGATWRDGVMIVPHAAVAPDAGVHFCSEADNNHRDKVSVGRKVHRNLTLCIVNIQMKASHYPVLLGFKPHT